MNNWLKYLVLGVCLLLSSIPSWSDSPILTYSIPCSQTNYDYTSHVITEYDVIAGGGPPTGWFNVSGSRIGGSPNDIYSVFIKVNEVTVLSTQFNSSTYIGGFYAQEGDWVSIYMACATGCNSKPGGGATVVIEY